jgi:hypothetical protein
MTQRLQELKQRAGIDYNPDQEGLNLFAELIVRECAMHVDEYADRTGDDILKHFGVDYAR